MRKENKDYNKKVLKYANIMILVSAIFLFIINLSVLFLSFFNPEILYSIFMIFKLIPIIWIKIISSFAIIFSIIDIALPLINLINKKNFNYYVGIIAIISSIFGLFALLFAIFLLVAGIQLLVFSKKEKENLKMKEQEENGMRLQI